jgi:hypothetical protein
MEDSGIEKFEIIHRVSEWKNMDRLEKDELTEADEYDVEEYVIEIEDCDENKEYVIEIEDCDENKEYVIEIEDCDEKYQDDDIFIDDKINYWIDFHQINDEPFIEIIVGVHNCYGLLQLQYGCVCELAENLVQDAVGQLPKEIRNSYSARSSIVLGLQKYLEEENLFCNVHAEEYDDFIGEPDEIEVENNEEGENDEEVIEGDS